MHSSAIYCFPLHLANFGATPSERLALVTDCQVQEWLIIRSNGPRPLMHWPHSSTGTAVSGERDGRSSVVFVSQVKQKSWECDDSTSGVFTQGKTSQRLLPLKSCWKGDDAFMAIKTNHQGRVPPSMEPPEWASESNRLLQHRQRAIRTTAARKGIYFGIKRWQYRVTHNSLVVNLG